MSKVVTSEDINMSDPTTYIIDKKSIYKRLKVRQDEIVRLKHEITSLKERLADKDHKSGSILWEQRKAYARVFAKAAYNAGYKFNSDGSDFDNMESAILNAPLDTPEFDG